MTKEGRMRDGSSRSGRRPDTGQDVEGTVGVLRGLVAEPTPLPPGFAERLERQVFAEWQKRRRTSLQELVVVACSVAVVFLVMGSEPVGAAELVFSLGLAAFYAFLINLLNITFSRREPPTSRSVIGA